MWSVRFRVRGEILGRRGERLDGPRQLPRKAFYFFIAFAYGYVVHGMAEVNLLTDDSWDASSFYTSCSCRFSPPVTVATSWVIWTYCFWNMVVDLLWDPLRWIVVLLAVHVVLLIVFACMDGGENLTWKLRRYKTSELILSDDGKLLPDRDGWDYRSAALYVTHFCALIAAGNISSWLP